MAGRASAFGCAEGATELSPRLVRQRSMRKHLPWVNVPQIILPLLAERGEGRGEESMFHAIGKTTSLIECVGVKEFLAVTNSTTINRDGAMFTVQALVSGLDQCWDTGLPYFVGHDRHRLIGWVVPQSVHIQPHLARLTAVIKMPENPEEEVAVRRAFIASTSKRISETLEPARSELQTKLQSFLSGEVEEAAPGCAAFVQNGLARRAFADIFEKADKDGLVPLRTLKPISAGIFEIDGLLLFAHPFLRRSLSRFNTLNAPFLAQLQSLTRQDDLNVRVALDPDMVGLARTHLEHREAQYWFGPKFNDDIAAIPLGVTRHEASDEDRLFAAVSRTEFWWYEQKDIRTFECEELQNIPSCGVGESQFGCRFVHSITSNDQKSFQHADGAIRLYDETAMIRRLEVDLKTAGRKTEYTKLWRVDGDISVVNWKRLISDYYRDNTLIGEYLGGKDKTLDEHREASKREPPPTSVSDYLPSQMAADDGVNVSVSYHPKFPESKSGRLVMSFDTLSSDTVRYCYVESDSLEIMKLLKRAGHGIEMEDDLVRVLFEDRILNLPLFAHSGRDPVRGANYTLSVIVSLLRRFSELDVEKLVSATIGVNYEDHAVFYSFAGQSRQLLEWLSEPDSQLPQRIADVPRWCARASAVISKRFQNLNVQDKLWQTLKTSGILKFDRNMLHPDKFDAQTGETGGARICAEIPKEDIHLFESQKIGLGRVAIIRNSECTQCGKAYEECLHSKYFDDGVVHRITSLELLALFWSDQAKNQGRVAIS